MRFTGILGRFQVESLRKNRNMSLNERRLVGILHGERFLGLTDIVHRHSRAFKMRKHRKLSAGNACLDFRARLLEEKFIMDQLKRIWLVDIPERFCVGKADPSSNNQPLDPRS